jgi:hypothetical protein
MVNFQDLSHMLIARQPRRSQRRLVNRGSRTVAGMVGKLPDSQPLQSSF